MKTKKTTCIHFFTLCLLAICFNNMAFANAFGNWNDLNEKPNVTLTSNIEIIIEAADCTTHRFIPRTDQNSVDQIYWIITRPSGGQDQIFGVFDPLYQFIEDGVHNVQAFINNVTCEFTDAPECDVCESPAFEVIYAGSGCVVGFENLFNAPAAQYVWDFGCGAPFSGSIPGPFDYSQSGCEGSGTYTVTLSAYDIGGNLINSCSRLITVDCGAPHCDALEMEEIGCGEYEFFYPLADDEDQIFWGFEYLETNSGNSYTEGQILGDNNPIFTFSQTGLYRVIAFYNNETPCTLFVDVICSVCDDAVFGIDVNGCTVVATAEPSSNVATYRWSTGCETKEGIATVLDFCSCGGGTYTIVLETFDALGNPVGTCSKKVNIPDDLGLFPSLDCHGYNLFFDYCYYSMEGSTCDPCNVETGNICINSSTPWLDSNPNGLPDEILGVSWYILDQTNYSWNLYHNGICMAYDAGDIAEGSVFRATVTIWGQSEPCEMYFDFSTLCSEGENGEGFQKRMIPQNDLINIYPNPANHIVNVDNHSKVNLSGTLSSIEGKLMTSFDLNSNTNKALNVNQFTNGIYFLKVMNPETSEIIRTEKILITD